MKNENSATPINAAVFLLCLAMIAALMLPTIVRQRVAARQSMCSVNLRKIGLAFHNYHSAYKQLPTACGGTTGGDTDESCNQGRLGVLVGLLPFIEQQRLWEKIINPYVDPTSGQRFPSMGPAPWYDAKLYRPWSQGPEVYRCPERADKPIRPAKPTIVYTLKMDDDMNPGLTTNYVACFGDGIQQVGEPAKFDDQNSQLRARATQRGMFMPGKEMKFRDILDGLSNTIMMSETRASVRPNAATRIAKNVLGLRDNPSLCLAAAKDADTQWWDFARGSRWCDGALPITGFQTVLPPNSPSCTSDQGIFEGVISVSSAHPGGVHVLFGDGRVGFISNTIDTGDLTSPAVHPEGIGLSRPGSPSPYGLWGALGTRANKETIDAQIPNVAPARQTNVAQKDRFTTWTDKNGEVRLSAKFVRIIDKQTIELEDAAGTLHQVPLNTLSDPDIFRAVSMDLMFNAMP